MMGLILHPLKLCAVNLAIISIILRSGKITILQTFSSINFIKFILQLNLETVSSCHLLVEEIIYIFLCTLGNIIVVLNPGSPR